MPPVARRRRCIPRWPGSDATPPRTGSRRSPAPESLHHRPSSPSQGSTSPPSTASTQTGPTATPAPESGRGAQQIPETLELGEGEGSTAELLRAPPPERMSFSPKRRADRTTTSSALLAGHLDKPTLYTGRGSTIPHPPAAGAAAGGQKIDDPTASEVVLLVWFTNSPLPTVAGKGKDQAALTRRFLPHVFFCTREAPGRPWIMHYVTRGGYNFTRRSSGIFCTE
jgi:hypothetical protein